MVACDLQELTNLVNHWHCSLRRWHAWNIVNAKHDEDFAWEIRREFLEASVHECLLRPSSLRDTFTSVATNALHQVRLSLGSNYPDFLEGDPCKPGEKPSLLSRKKKELRLSRITSVWVEAKDFLGALQKLDDTAYRHNTSDYRNLTSHTIGPRLGVGHTRTVTRTVEQATSLERQQDGTFADIPIPGKMPVGYDYGGTSPLDLNETRLVNLSRFAAAQLCYKGYRRLLKVADEGISD